MCTKKPEGQHLGSVTLVSLQLFMQVTLGVRRRFVSLADSRDTRRLLPFSASGLKTGRSYVRPRIFLQTSMIVERVVYSTAVNLY